MTTAVESAECLSTAAVPSVAHPGMIVLWCGVSAAMPSTCIASSNGLTLSKCNSSAPCAGRSGSLKSEWRPVRGCGKRLRHCGADGRRVDEIDSMPNRASSSYRALWMQMDPVSAYCHLPLFSFLHLCRTM